MQHASRNDELSQFKTEINLCEFLASKSYLLDRRNSSRCSAVMKHANGDKLIVARSESKAWIYFNVHGTDSGTIIDFIQRDSLSLGEVRKTLRPWLGRPACPIENLRGLPTDLTPSKKDNARVLAAWMRAQAIGETNHFLSSKREIPAKVFCHPKFFDRIRIDSRSNVLFGHWDKDGLCGYEVKNKSSNGRSFTGFAPGGTKGLFFSTPMECDRELILCETAIDLLSIVALRGIDGMRLMSTGGQVSPLQLELIASAVKKMPSNSQVRLAMDNDEPGRGLADRIASYLVDQELDSDRIVFNLPPTQNADWNDELRRAGKVASIPPSPSTS